MSWRLGVDVGGTKVLTVALGHAGIDVRASSEQATLVGSAVLEVIDRVASDGGTGVVVSAVGFVADHLEVLYDLDIEAAHRAAAHGIAFARTACVNDDASVIDALAARQVNP